MLALALVALTLECCCSLITEPSASPDRLDFPPKWGSDSDLDRCLRAEFDSYPRSKYPKLFVSEYSSPRRLFPNSTTLGAAVAEAIYMAGMCAATLSLTLRLLMRRGPAASTVYARKRAQMRSV